MKNRIEDAEKPWLDQVRGRKIKNLIGQKFGRLFVIKNTGKRKNSQAVWLCRCACGNECEIRSHSLLAGDTKSCGCLKMERIKQTKKSGNNNPNFKHGDTVKRKLNRLFTVWCGMKQRCLDKNSGNYKYYGGRGIKIYNEWKNNYLSFKNWALFHGYKAGLTIDRINNNEGYCPENCQWITNSENLIKSHRERIV